jgi:anion-transporting  ArsA/GET3 family ATPase
MAMEKLYALKDDLAYDLVVLDTPPTSNALDFLDAPERMISAVDSPAIRALVTAFEGAGRISLNLISQAMAKVLTGFAKFTGAGFLEQVAEFLVDVQSLFGGFRERATRVREALKSPSVAFVIVTSPDPMAINEAMFFGERLTEGGMYTEGLVVNRVRVSAPVEVSSPQRLANVIRDAGVEPALELAGAALKAHHDLYIWAHRDASEVSRIKRELRNVPRVVEVPAFDYDVHDVAALRRVAELLTAGDLTSRSDSEI